MSQGRDDELYLAPKPYHEADDSGDAANAGGTSDREDEGADEQPVALNREEIHAALGKATTAQRERFARQVQALQAKVDDQLAILARLGFAKPAMAGNVTSDDDPEFMPPAPYWEA